jgi:hypothetical protein
MNAISSLNQSIRGFVMNEYCHKGMNCHKACMMNANCDILMTSAGVKGCMLDATMATIIIVSMANDASSTSSRTRAVVATTSATIRRVSPSTRAWASSPDAYSASTSFTRRTSAALISAIKHGNYNNKHKQQQKTQLPWQMHHASRAQQSLDKQQIE